MNELDLSSTFNHAGWSIKYNLASRQSTQHETVKQTQTQTQTIVFVHGTPWSSAVFRPLAAALLSLPNPPQILLYDLPGYGCSQETNSPSAPDVGPEPAPSFTGDTSVKAQSAALAALLAHLNLTGRGGDGTPAVVAHDIAGSIALRTHLLHDCSFAKLLLLDTNAVLPWGDGFYKLARAEPQVFLDLPAPIHEAVVRAVVRSALHDPASVGEAWVERLVEPWVDRDGGFARQASFVRQIAQADDGDVAEMLDGALYSKVGCDVQMLWGEHDKWIPRAKLEQLGQLLGSRFKGLVTVPEAGHLVMLDQPERVTAEVLAWLDTR